jgi:type II secretory pathway component GspD/PulD (secretin)
MRSLTHRFILLPLFAIAAFVSAAVAQAPKPAPTTPAEKTYTVSFDKTPWLEVFEWFSKESGLTYIDTVKPIDTFTFKSDRKYTLPQVVDLLNEAIASQKLYIYRRSQTFLVMGIGERNPDMKPRMITIDELSNWGDTEVVMVFLPLTDLVFEDIQPQMKKLLSSLGSASGFGANQIIILDKAKNIRNIIHYIGIGKNEDPGYYLYECKNVRASIAAEQLKLLLADANTVTSGNTNTTPTTYPWGAYGGGGFGGGGWGTPAVPASPRDTPAPQERRFRQVQISVDTESNTLRITGPAEKIVAAQELIKSIDKPPVCVIPTCPPQCVVRAQPCRLRQIFHGRCR